MIGLVSGYIRWLDAIVMRLMDGLMAIPAILLAIALVVPLSRRTSEASSWRSSCRKYRACALVRAIVLSVRGEPYVEAAISPVRPRPADRSPHPAEHVPALIVQGTLHLRQRRS